MCSVSLGASSPPVSPFHVCASVLPHDILCSVTCSPGTTADLTPASFQGAPLALVSECILLKGTESHSTMT